MGYFDGLTDAVFKKDSAGNNVFYPWGIFGSGFIIHSEDQKNQIRNFYKTMYRMMLPAIVIIHVLVGVWLNLVLLPIYIAWYHLRMRKITKDLPKTLEKLKISEAYKNSAKSHNLPTLIFLGLISIGFVAIGAFLLKSGENALIACAMIGLFGLCSVVMGCMIKTKIQSKKS